MGQTESPVRRFRCVDAGVILVTTAILAVVSLASIDAAREAARRTRCANNLKQYGLGLLNYHDTHKAFPIGGSYDPRREGSWPNRTRPQIGWQVRLLPYMEQLPLYDQLDFIKSEAIWDNDIRAGTELIKVRSVQVPYAMCPSDPGEVIIDGWAQSSYCGNLGSQFTVSRNAACNTWTTAGVHYDGKHGTTVFGSTHQSHLISGVFSRFGATQRLASITDGSSNTIAVGEILVSCNDHTYGWWHYNGMANAHASMSVPLNTMTTCASSEQQCKERGYFNCRCWEKSNWNYSWGFRSKHPGGANFGFADGSARFISETINYRTYQNLGSRSDGNAIEALDN